MLLWEGMYQNSKTLLHRERKNTIETRSLKYDFALNGVKATVI